MQEEPEFHKSGTQPLGAKKVIARPFSRDGYMTNQARSKKNRVGTNAPTLPKLCPANRPQLDHNDLGAVADAFIKINHIFVAHTDTAG